MNANPLQPPDPGSPLLQEFLTTQQIDTAQAPLELLTQVVGAFAGLPFENLTKIIKNAEAGNFSEARRAPAEVLADHWSYGTGGTCFALTSALLYLVRALGWQAEPILADRRYGPDTHSALLVWIEGRPHLIDPGYLIVKPLPLPAAGEVSITTPFNQLILATQNNGAKVELHTIQDRQKTYRLTFKTDPADPGHFLHAWDVSFDQDMMRYPVLSRVTGGQQLYLQKNHLLIRNHTASERTELPPDRLIHDIARQFGIAPAIAARAFDILKRRGVAPNK